MNPMLKIRQLAIALLDDEEGISEQAYELLYDFLDDDMKRQVDATDGRFYLPESFKDGEAPENEQDVQLSYLQNVVRQIIPEAQFEYDNYGQLVIYTGLANDDENNFVVPFEAKND